MTTINGRNRIEIAEAIRDHTPFKTYGSLRADVVDGLGRYADYGYLSDADLDRFIADSESIVYVVWSYSTPIAWATKDGAEYKVEQKFSMTTSKAQGLLYLFGDDER